MRRSHRAAVLSLCALVLLASGAGLLLGRHRKEEPQPYVPGEVLVRYREGSSEWEKASARDRVRGRRKKHIRFRHLDFDLVRVEEGLTVEQAVERLSSDPRVEYAEPNWRVEMLGMGERTPNDSQFAQQWHLDHPAVPGTVGPQAALIDVDMDAPQGWAVLASAYWGTLGTAVGVLDSGCGSQGFFSINGRGYHPNHPDLLISDLFHNPADTADGLDNDGNGKTDDTNGWDFINNTASVADTPGYSTSAHGTAVAAILGAETDNGLGIAALGWNRLLILPLKCMGQGAESGVADIIQAVAYATSLRKAGRDVSALNGSFDIIGHQDSQGLRDMVWAAGDAGLLFVAAAGNDFGNDNDVLPTYPANYSRFMPHVLAVGATDDSGDFAAFSNFGLFSVQAAAPGKDIRTAFRGDGYTWENGTSFAAPLAAASAALAMAGSPGMSPAWAILRVTEGGDLDERLLGRTVSGKRVNLSGTMAPFHPYSGWAYVTSTKSVTLHEDSVSKTYDSISVASVMDSSVAVLKRQSSTSWAVSPREPGVTDFTLSFGGASAPLHSYQTGPWRVTAIAPFWARLTPGGTMAFSAVPGYAGTWKIREEGSGTWVTANKMARIDSSTGVLTALNLGGGAFSDVRVGLIKDGSLLDESGPIVIGSSPPPPPASKSAGCGCGSMRTPSDPPWTGLGEAVLLLLGMALAWMMARRMRV